MSLNNVTRIFFVVLTSYFLTPFSVFAGSANAVTNLSPGELLGVNWLLVSVVLIVSLVLFIFFWFKVDYMSISTKMVGILIIPILVVLVMTMEGVGYVKIDEQSLERTIIIIAVLGILFTIAIGVIIARSIAHSLAVLVSQATAMENGDLRQKIDIVTHDEIGQLQKSLSAMQEKMKNTVLEINTGATELSDAAEQVSQGNTDLSQRTQEQASSLEEISSSMEEMTSTVNQNSDNAEQASDIALEARIQADKGSVLGHGVVTAMKEIDGSSEKISNIIGVIDEIAFQTNLLALNAAVEAARAGDQGRGFAVVASEVRNLAGRSAVAAKEIKALIQESVEKVKDGTKLVGESGSVLNDIVEAVKKAGDRISEIAVASKEQAQGISQVNQALLQMDQMTQGNAALVEEASATSEALGRHAQHLIDLVSSFNTGDEIKIDIEEMTAEPIEEISLKPDSHQVNTGMLSLPKEHNAENSDEWKDF